MPHLIVEYAQDKAGTINHMDVMKAVHSAALSTALFAENAIKVRVKQYDAALVGGEPDSFVHVTIYLIDGRDRLAKKQLTSVVHTCIEELFGNCASVSVDARDLDRDVYTKSVRHS